MEGIDFFKTYTPVVQWMTVRLLRILKVLLNLKSKQGDVTATFLHCALEEDKNVYVEIPTVFNRVWQNPEVEENSLRFETKPQKFMKVLDQGYGNL